MAETFTIREGITDPIVFGLQEIDPDTGEASAVDLTGVTEVELRLQPKAGGSALSFATAGGQISVTDASGGEVTFVPAADDLDDAARGYDGYIKITDAAGTVISFPSGDNFVLKVIKGF